MPERMLLSAGECRCRSRQPAVKMNDMMKKNTHPAVSGVSPPLFAILGGDRRAESLVRALSEKGYSCRLYACSLPGESHLADALTGVSAVILPIPASRDGDSLFAPFHRGEHDPEEKISLCADLLPALRRLAPRAELLCGMPPDALAEGAERAEIRLFDYGRDEEFLLENARLTAEGMLPLLEKHLKTPLSARDSALVAGYGRVGKATAKILAERGVKVTVLCRSDSAAAEAKKAGHGVLSFRDLPVGGVLPNAALLCNTVPVPIFGKQSLSAFGGVYVELASAPGGLKEDEAARRREDPAAYLALPGIPGKMLPEEAGRAAARAILRHLDAARGKEGTPC